MSAVTTNLEEQRHYLDDKPIHCGDALELEVAKDVWLPVRYEASPHNGNMHETLHCSFGIIHPRHRYANLRWPARR